MFFQNFLYAHSKVGQAYFPAGNCFKAGRSVMDFGSASVRPSVVMHTEPEVATERANNNFKMRQNPSYLTNLVTRAAPSD